MSSDYYFQRWQKALQNLETTISLDLDYQEREAHDKELCDAALRISGILGSYMACYNDTMECQQHNLQVQKTDYIQNIVISIVSRILELKQQLRNLNGCYYVYLCGGLTDHKLTPFDTELKSLPAKCIRPNNILCMIDNALQKAQNKSKDVQFDLEDVAEPDVDPTNWWDLPDEAKEDTTRLGINITGIYEVETIVSEETLTRKKMLYLIQTQEKTRQIIKGNILRQQRRIVWEKELNGSLKAPARLEIRERGAKVIQNVMRKYFEIKRQKIKLRRIEELLGMKICERTNDNYQDKTNQITERCKLANEFHEKWRNNYVNRKNNLLKQKKDFIVDDYREFIREWFRQWFEEIQFIHAIPKEKDGGLSLILKEEFPSPLEWLELYKAYKEQKIAKKNKTQAQLKYEKLEIEREKLRLRKVEIRKKKLDAQLQKKIMKNPNMHPGYHFPASKKITRLLESIEAYKSHWSEWDKLDILNVKQGFINEIDIQNIHCDVKQDILTLIHNDVRQEYQTLKTALKKDYEKNDMPMPENMKELKRRKKKRKPKKVQESDLFDTLCELAVNNILVEYPTTTVEDFLGDYNFVGDQVKCDLRCLLVHPFGGETRLLWWERCHDLMHGFRKILLVGPSGSGKSVLVHIMATMNDATLYNLNLLEFENKSKGEIKSLISALLLCAKATQPSIIYIKHVHRLYYKKVTTNTALRKLLVNRLNRNIRQTDQISLIGSCIAPWLTKSKQITKHFPNVVLMPPTLYSAVQLVLSKWVSTNRIVPTSLDIQSLARHLQGYSLGYLNKNLEEFLTPDRIIRIAAFGLSPEEIYDYFLQSEYQPETDYEKYHKWYLDNTQWGNIEKKHIGDQLEFRNNVQRWKEKMAKKEK